MIKSQNSVRTDLDFGNQKVTTRDLTLREQMPSSRKKIRGIEAVEEVDPLDELKTYILSVVNKLPTKPATEPEVISTVTAKPQSITSILKTRFAKKK